DPEPGTDEPHDRARRRRCPRPRPHRPPGNGLPPNGHGHAGRLALCPPEARTGRGGRRRPGPRGLVHDVEPHHGVLLAVDGRPDLPDVRRRLGLGPPDRSRPGTAPGGRIGPMTDDLLVGLDEIRAARERIAGHVHRTPMLSSSTAARMVAAAGGPRLADERLYLKAENLQKNGSVKARRVTQPVRAARA